MARGAATGSSISTLPRSERQGRSPQQRPGRGAGRPPSRVARFFGALGILFGILLTFLLLALIGAAGYAAYLVRETARDLPNQQSIFLEYTPGGVTTIYATDKDPKTGKLVVLGRVYSQYKEYCPITQIPEVMKKATIAIEDERFKEHRGIDLEGIARAFYKNILAGNMSEGGSTLTQQLARNIYLNKKKTFQRKLQEALLAILLEKNFSKEQILEMYLNEVCYGVNTYGVRAASKLYFGREPKHLSLSQAALLAGIPQRPSSLEPFAHKEAAISRRNVVLGKMRQLAYIKPEEEQVARSNGVRLITNKPQHHTVFKAPYFTNYVLKQLYRKYGEEAAKNGGWQIYTTLNYQMQQEAERALINGVIKARDSGVTQGALVSVEPRTGYIRAMVGGIDFKKDEFNHTAQGGRQPGSSFKVIVYSTALSVRPDRFTADSSVDNSRISYGSYSPDGGGPGGSVPLRRAFAFSYNNASVNTTNSIGVRRVIEYARKMGITSRLEPNLSLALGSYEVTPLEMAAAYAIFPNHGNRAEPMSVIRVVDSEGVVLENNQPQVEVAALPESTVAQMSDLMGDVVEYGTASKAEGIHDVPGAHGKTGTTNDNKDAWFVGYTPELSTSVWICGVRREMRKGRSVVRYVPMARDSTGGGKCAPIWARFMKAAIPIQRRSKMPILPSPEKVVPVKNPLMVQGEKKPASPDPLEEETARQERRDAPAAGVPDDAIAAATDTATTVAATNTPAAEGALAPENSTTAGGAVVPALAPPIATAPPLRRSVAAIAPAVAAVAPPAAPPAEPEMVTISVCAETGRRATVYCPETIQRSFVRGRAPRKTCSVHRTE